MSSAQEARLMAKVAEILFRHKIRFVALSLIPIAVGGSVAVVFATYRATATLRIEDPSAFGASFIPVGWSPNQTPAQNLADSVGQVVKTSAFAQGLSDRLSAESADSGSSELKQTLATLGANFKATASDSHLVTLTYTCPRSSLCQSVMSSAIAIYQDQVIGIQKSQATTANVFWSDQLKVAQANLASAMSAAHDYAAANPGTPVDVSSSDPQAAQLANDIQLWRAKVDEAQNSMSQAQYLATASARFLQVGTTVADAPHIAGSRFVGDRSSLLPAGIVLLAGLALVVAYALLVAWSDRTAGDPRALERRLGVPVVATIPKLVSSRGF
jgi:capsular polysaccharide biosynthesis protein